MECVSDDIVPSSSRDWLDRDRYTEYLLSRSAKDKEIVMTVVDNTYYFTKQQTVAMVHSSLAKLHKLIDRYYVFVCTDKVGSEHWLLLESLPLMKGHVVDFIIGWRNPRVLDPNIPIVLLDDAIYSSCYMCSQIDMLKDTYKKKHGVRMNNHFYCVVAVTSSMFNIQVVRSYNAMIVCDLSLTRKWASKLIPEYDAEYMYKQFDCEVDSVLPLLFEHKIANRFGSYQFYHKIVRTPPDRSHIDRITLIEVISKIEQFMKEGATSS